MAAAAHRVLGGCLRAGLIVSPSGVAVPPLEHIAGGHPVPTEGSERAGRRALELARAAGDSGNELLVLISGGASALMALPAEGLSLEDKRKTTDVLLRAGADIHALNTVRKHLSGIKGGQLAAAARSGCQALAISDVVGDDPSVIGSGPTVADPSTFADALRMIDRFGGRAAFPPPIVKVLADGASGARPDTPKPGDPRLARAETRVIGGRHNAMQGAAAEARKRGYHVLVLEPAIVGDAREAARDYLGQIAGRLPRLERPACVISSGETTVHVTGTGRGGRNQEFALTSAGTLASIKTAALASAGTDGIDGPTDAAGAIADTRTLERARQRGLPPPAAYLNDNNSFAFFDALGDLIRTGPTGTNVGDLQVFLLA